MNLQQVAEGVQLVLQSFPQLVEESSYVGSKYTINDVVSVLEAFGCDLTHSPANNTDLSKPQKRKKIASPVSESVPVSRAKKTSVTDTVKSNKTTDFSTKVHNSGSYSKVLCSFLSSLLVGTFVPVRTYQKHLTVLIINTFRPMISTLLSFYSQKHVYKPAFNTIDEKSPEMLSHTTKEALLSTLESLTIIAKMEIKCIPHIYSALASFPVPLAQLQDCGNPDRFARIIFQILTMHPSAPRILSSFWGWSSLKDMLSSPSELTRYFTSMALSAFNYLSDADQLRFVHKTVTFSQASQENNLELSVEHRLAVDHEKGEVFSTLSRAWQWTVLVRNAINNAQEQIRRHSAFIAKKEEPEMNATTDSQLMTMNALAAWQDSVCSGLINFFQSQSVDSDGQTRSALGPSNSSDLFGLSASSGQDVVSINGVTVSVRNGANTTSQSATDSPSSYVYVESSDSSVKSLAMALNETRPILLEGPAGSGKSLLIDHMARLTHNRDYLRIYIDDQMDSKTLLGTQTCTDIPGEFVWRAGALAQALQQGRWVVLEDVHRAQFEVLAALIPLFEKNVLLIPGRAEVLTAAPGFRLIATWTTGGSSISGTFIRNYLSQKQGILAIKSEDTMCDDIEPETAISKAVTNIDISPGAALSQLSNMASSASSPAHVLLHRLFTRILVPSFTLEDVRSIILSKYSLLRRMSGLVDTVIETTRCFSAPSTIPDQLANAYMNMTTVDSDDELDSDDEENYTGESEKVVRKTKNTKKPLTSSPALARFAHNAPSPFGPACAVSLRHLSRFAERVERILSNAPTVKIQSTGTDTRFPDMHTLQVQLSADLALAIVRAALDCFTAAAPPTNSSHVIEKRRNIILCAAALWQVQRTDIEASVMTYKPSLTVTDYEVRINQYALERNKARSLQFLGDPHMSKFSLTRHALLNMEKIYAAICSADPLLLVGETGNGKTTIVQHLAAQLGQTLHVHNMNQQSEASDLLGGFKPVELRVACVPLMNDFGTLFPKTFSRTSNKTFLQQIKQAFDQKNWKILVHYFKQTLKNVQTKIKASMSLDAATAAAAAVPASLKTRWLKFAQDVLVFERRLQQTSSFAFWFAEGSLVKAIREGHWVLLDEVNLASAETLDRLASLLEDNKGSVTLTERGDIETVHRHPNFRLFSCMNPATDAGKKDLPPHIRDRFCELYINDIEDEQDLDLIVREALAEGSSSQLHVPHIVAWFRHVKMLCKTVLLDGAMHRPHYSPRSLVRALRFAKKHAPFYGTLRAFYEGVCLSFSSPLHADSRLLLDSLLWQHVFGPAYRAAVNNAATHVAPALGSVPPIATQHADAALLNKFLGNFAAASQKKALAANKIVIGAHAISPGPSPIDNTAKDTFITTPTVDARLNDVARAIVSRLPVLLQGPTSAGKTSLVTYLAAVTGNKCVRINNHLHTDVQEYIGSYVTDSNGNLVFQEGILVTAVRNGYWIILDELNLAPSEVLESLNRLLDDNNEIFIAETQETVRAHPSFLLFATQNPPGLYGGRKVLSRAFTNRFVQLHTDDLPEDELITILERRCKIPLSYAEKMVAIMKDLQKRRQGAGMLGGKKALLTPRDLFRWADRKPVSYNQLAEDGYLLLGERLRNDESKSVVKEVLETHCKCTIDLVEIYNATPVPMLDGGSSIDIDTAAQKRANEENEHAASLIKGGGKALRKKRKEEKEKAKAKSATMTDNSVADAIVEANPQLFSAMNDSTMTEEELAVEKMVQDEMAKIGSVAWTFSMRRLFTLVYRCVQHNEPVLLVGAAGAGKTMVCQILALVLRRKLDIINCHQHTETSDFLGGLRPVRGKDKIIGSLIVGVKKLGSHVPELTSILASLSETVTDALVPKDPENLTLEDKMVSGVRAVVESQASLPSFPDITDLNPQSAAQALSTWFDKLKNTLAKANKGLKRISLAALSLESRKQLPEAESTEESLSSEAIQKILITTPLLTTVLDTFEAELPAVQANVQSFNALFEWKDGVLVTAMKQGHLLLLDEISLADDAVLERLNSVLETTRTLFLAEKGGSQVESITAHPNFAIVATMNPGGDFGKKELSPALRNRFTEVWVPNLENREDLLAIISERFMQPLKKDKHGNAKPLETGLTSQQIAIVESRKKELKTFAEGFSPLLLDFIEFFNKLRIHRKQFSLRDVLAWVSLMTHLFLQPPVSTESATEELATDHFMEQCYVHAASLVILDGLSVGAADGDSQNAIQKTEICVEFLLSQLPETNRRSLVDTLTYALVDSVNPVSLPALDSSETSRAPNGYFGVEPFYIPRGKHASPTDLPFAVEAHSTRINLTRVLRALQLPRAVLLEGSPGVGKTSLISALAKMAGHKLVRINLSEQTDMLDLLGSDLPVHGGEGGQFVWCDGVFLQALKAGDWVLLDELNLASQSVLEGLNAVLDHRAQIYLPELDKTFDCPPTFRLFAAQNPMAQGGGRKGLPASFLSRFTKVWLHAMTTQDLLGITHKLYPDIAGDYLKLMIAFNQAVHQDTMVDKVYGRVGSPWEFNLRDVFRWCDLVRHSSKDLACILDPESTANGLSLITYDGPNDFGVGASFQHPGAFLDIMYLQRMRTEADREALRKRFTILCEELNVSVATKPTSPESETETEAESTTVLIPSRTIQNYHRVDETPEIELTPSVFRIGNAWVPRLPCRTGTSESTLSASSSTVGKDIVTLAKAIEAADSDDTLFLHQMLRPLEHLTRCVSRAWPIILAGEAATGKTSLIRMLAKVTNNDLHEIAISSSADSTDLLGCFEQVDWDRHRSSLLGCTRQLANFVISSLLIEISGKTSVAMEKNDLLDEVVRVWDAFCLAESRDISVQTKLSGGKSEVKPESEENIIEDMNALTNAKPPSIAPCFKDATFSLLGHFYTLAERVLSLLPAEDLSGPTGLSSHLLPSVLRETAEVFQHNTTSAKLAVGRFEWIDGTLLKALERGSWVILDNVNFCNPTVLDRLNGLLEPSGTLLVNECGLVNGEPRIVVPHPNFRIFLTMDTQFGEISRAMRNRCVEITLTQQVGAVNVHTRAHRLIATTLARRAASAFNTSTMFEPVKYFSFRENTCQELFLESNTTVVSEPPTKTALIDSSHESLYSELLQSSLIAAEEKNGKSTSTQSDRAVATATRRTVAEPLFAADVFSPLAVRDLIAIVSKHNIPGLSLGSFFAQMHLAMLLFPSLLAASAHAAVTSSSGTTTAEKPAMALASRFKVWTIRNLTRWASLTASLVQQRSSSTNSSTDPTLLFSLIWRAFFHTYTLSRFAQHTTLQHYVSRAFSFFFARSVLGFDAQTVGSLTHADNDTALVNSTDARFLLPSLFPLNSSVLASLTFPVNSTLVKVGRQLAVVEQLVYFAVAGILVKHNQYSEVSSTENLLLVSMRQATLGDDTQSSSEPGWTTVDDFALSPSAAIPHALFDALLMSRDSDNLLATAKTKSTDIPTISMVDVLNTALHQFIMSASPADVAIRLSSLLSLESLLRRARSDLLDANVNTSTSDNSTTLLSAHRLAVMQRSISSAAAVITSLYSSSKLVLDVSSSEAAYATVGVSSVGQSALCFRRELAHRAGLYLSYIDQQPLDMLSSSITTPYAITRETMESLGETAVAATKGTVLALIQARIKKASPEKAFELEIATQRALAMQHIAFSLSSNALRVETENAMQRDLISKLVTSGLPLPASVRNGLYPLALSLACAKGLVPPHTLETMPFVLAAYPAFHALSGTSNAILYFLSYAVRSIDAGSVTSEFFNSILALLTQTTAVFRIRTQLFNSLWSASLANPLESESRPFVWDFGSLLVRSRVLSVSYTVLVGALQSFIVKNQAVCSISGGAPSDVFNVLISQLRSNISHTDNLLSRASQGLMTQSGGSAMLHTLVGQRALGRSTALLVSPGPAFSSLQASLTTLNDILRSVPLFATPPTALSFFDNESDPDAVVASANNKSSFATYAPTSSIFENASTLWLPPHLHWALPSKLKETLSELMSSTVFARSPLLFKTVAKSVADEIKNEALAFATQTLKKAVFGGKASSKVAESEALRQQKYIRAFLATLTVVPNKLVSHVERYLKGWVNVKASLLRGTTLGSISTTTTAMLTVPDHAFLAPLEDAVLASLWSSLVSALRNAIVAAELAATEIVPEITPEINTTSVKKVSVTIARALVIGQRLLEYMGYTESDNEQSAEALVQALAEVSSTRLNNPESTDETSETVESASLFADILKRCERSRFRSTATPADAGAIRSALQMMQTVVKDISASGLMASTIVSDDLLTSLHSVYVTISSRLHEFIWNNSLVSSLFTRYKIGPDGSLVARKHVKAASALRSDVTLLNEAETRALFSQFTGLGSSALSLAVSALTLKNLPTRAGSTSVSKRNLRIRQLQGLVENMILSVSSKRSVALATRQGKQKLVEISTRVVTSAEEPVNDTLISNKTVLAVISSSAISLYSVLAETLTKMVPAYPSTSRSKLLAVIQALVDLAIPSGSESSSIAVSFPSKDEVLEILASTTHPLILSMGQSLLIPLFDVIYSHTLTAPGGTPTYTTEAWVALSNLLLGLINLRLSCPIAPIDPSEISLHQSSQTKSLLTSSRLVTSIRQWSYDVQSSAPSSRSAPRIVGTSTSVMTTASVAEVMQLQRDGIELDPAAMIASVPLLDSTDNNALAYSSTTASPDALIAASMVGDQTRIDTLQRQLTFRSVEHGSKTFSNLFDSLQKFASSGVEVSRTIQLAHNIVTFISSSASAFAQRKLEEADDMVITKSPAQVASQLLREECMLQDVTQAFLKSVHEDYSASFPDVCIPVTSAIYTIKTSMRDLASLLSSAVSTQTLAIATASANISVDEEKKSKKSKKRGEHMPEAAKTISGTLYSLLSFPVPTIPIAVAASSFASLSETNFVDANADPLLYLLSGKITLSLQSLSDTAMNIQRAKERANAAARKARAEEFERSQAELRKRIGDAYGEDVVSENPFGVNDNVDSWNVENSVESGSMSTEVLAATEEDGDDGFDGIASDDEDEELTNNQSNTDTEGTDPHDYSKLPLLVFRAVLLRLIVCVLTSPSGPTALAQGLTPAEILKGRDVDVASEPHAAMDHKLARLVAIIFGRVLAGYRKQQLAKKRLEEKEKEEFKFKSSHIEFPTEEEEIARELKEMYPDFTHEYDDIMSLTDKFNSTDLNGDDDRIAAAKEAEIMAQRAQARVDDLVEEDINCAFLAFKLMFACAQSGVTINLSNTDFSVPAHPAYTLLKPAVETLRSLAISASQSAAAMLISALETTQSSHAMLTADVDNAAFPGQLFALSSAYLFLNQTQTTSTSSIASTLNATALVNNKNLNTTTSAVLATTCAADLVQTLYGMCASLCPALAPVPPMDTTNKKLTWKKQDRMINSVAAGEQSGEHKLVYHDVWRHPNMKEVQKLVGPLRTYQNRIRYLLSLFPSHPILRQLALIAARIAALPLNSPIMKVLSGLEILLKKSEEWESYAHSRVKLTAELFDISILVARWRKLELHSWPMALKRKDDDHEVKSVGWWCRLYPIVHCTPEEMETYKQIASLGNKPSGPNGEIIPISSKKRKAEEEASAKTEYDNYLLQLHTALQEFIVYSSIGELKARLAIVLAFRNQIDAEIRSGHALMAHKQGTRLPVSTRVQVRNMLEHVFRQYAQFVPLVTKHLNEEKAPLEQTIMEQVKLSVWDLSNYWSLKDSSEKSHRKVHKLASDYDILLKTPFSAVLQKIAGSDVSTAGPGVGTPHLGPVYKDYAAAKLAAKLAITRLRRSQGVDLNPKQQKRRLRLQKKAIEEMENSSQERRVRLNAGEITLAEYEQQEKEAKELLEKDKKDQEDREDEENELMSAGALAKRTSHDATAVLATRYHVPAQFASLIQKAESTVPEALASLTPELLGSSVFLGPLASWLPMLISLAKKSGNDDSKTGPTRLPLLFSRMLSLLRRSILSNAALAGDNTNIATLDELAIATMQRVERLTSDEAPIQTKKMAFTDTLKLLKTVGLSHHSSASGMLILSTADVEAEGSIFSQAADMDLFSESALPAPPAGPGSANAATGGNVAQSTMHDIHSASLSLLSSSAAARGVQRQDKREDVLLNVLTNSFQTITAAVGRNGLDAADVMDSTVDATADVSKPRKLAKALTAGAKTNIVQLPLWFLQNSLMSQLPGTHVAIPSILSSATGSSVVGVDVVDIPIVETLPRAVADSTMLLAQQIDSSIHEAFTALRKLRTRVANSQQKDVARAAILKAHGMVEHLFSLITTSVRDMAAFAPRMHVLQQWIASLNLLAKTDFALTTEATESSMMDITSVTTIAPCSTVEILEVPVSCTLPELGTIIQGLAEAAEGELLLLHRLQTTLRSSNAIYSALVHKIDALTSVTPALFCVEDIQASVDTSNTMSLPSGLVPALRALHSKVASVLAFVQPSTLHGGAITADSMSWSATVQARVDRFIRHVLVVVRTILGSSMARAVEMLPFSSLAGTHLGVNALEARTLTSTSRKSRSVIPGPASPWRALCADVFSLYDDMLAVNPDVANSIPMEDVTKANYSTEHSVRVVDSVVDSVLILVQQTYYETRERLEASRKEREEREATRRAEKAEREAIAKAAKEKAGIMEDSPVQEDEDVDEESIEDISESHTSSYDSIENIITKQIQDVPSKLYSEAVTRILRRLTTASSVLEALSFQYRALMMKRAVDDSPVLAERAAALRSQISTMTASLASISPFVHQVSLLVSRQMVVCLSSTRGALRFLQVLLAVLNVILVKGLCRKPDEEDGDGEGEGEGQAQSGTGMGEGAGGKDVSEQITDEEQLLGTKNERQDQSNQDQNEDQDTESGVEMRNDFDGDMVDVPKDEKEEEEKDDGEDQGEELDREMGDLEQDEQDVVDEKLWNNEEDNDDEIDRSKEKQEDSSLDGGDDQESETVAGDDKPQEKPTQKEKEKEKKKEKEKDDTPAENKPDAEEEQEEEKPGSEEDDPKDKEDFGQVNADDPDRKEEDHGIDAQDLPDDLQIEQPDDEEPPKDEKDEEEQEEVEGGEENKDEKPNEGENPVGEEQGDLAEDMKDSEEQTQEEEAEGQEGPQDDEKDPQDQDQDQDADDGKDESSMRDDDQTSDDVVNDQDNVAALPNDDQEPEKNEEEEPQEEGEDEEKPQEREDMTGEDDSAQQADKANADADMGFMGGSDASDGSDQKKKQDAAKAPKNADKNEDEKSENKDEEESSRLNQADAAQQDTQGEAGEYREQDEKMHGQAPQNKDKKQQPPKPQKLDNPFASLGDALKRWKQNLDILESEDLGPDAPEKENEGADDKDHDKDLADDMGDESISGTVEHARKNETADAQVMASVDEHNDQEDQLPKMPEESHKMEDAEEDGNADLQEAQQEAMEDGEADEDDELDDEEEGDSTNDKTRKKAKAAQNSTKEKEEGDDDADEVEDEDHDDEDHEKMDEFLEDLMAMLNEETGADGGAPSGPFSGDMDALAETEDSPDTPDEEVDTETRAEKTAEELQSMREELDKDLDAFNSGDSSSRDGKSRAENAHKLWQSLTTVTGDLSQQLCEQLRIILEPSLASKLAGDYRTGKRINIKKIIPFIASQFRRDKIWLRRTAPNKRNYQVLIAIDDSGSMRDNKAARVALESLAVLCQALTQLEVGELSVVSFGDQVRLLHSFSTPFTPDSGAYVVSAFEFNQRQTQWPSLLQRVTSVLDHARESGGSQGGSEKENLQLVFIISDARVQQDREVVARLTREALEKRQLLCLLIIDSENDQNSIINIKSVIYPTAIPGTKGLGPDAFKIKVVDYLENFPFPYYTILRNIQTLPEVVADALREWFELIQRAS